MKTAIFFIAAASVSSAAISNFRVLGTTATQALVAYTAPDANACTVQVSQNSSLTPPVLDVDPGTFSNSNVDLDRASTVTMGLSRAVVIGQRTAQYATAGTYAGVRHFSRALQNITPHYGKLTCPSTGDTVTFQFTTSNVPLGLTYGDPWLADASVPGAQPWPEYLGGTTPESFIDPLTGALLERVTMRDNLPNVYSVAPYSANNQGHLPCDAAGPWTNPCGTVVTGGSGNTTVGNSTAPMILRPDMAYNNNGFNPSYGLRYSLDKVGISLTGFVNSTSFNNLDVCASLNGGASCASGNLNMTLGTTTSTQTAGAAPTSGFYPSTWGTTSFELDTNPRLNLQEASPHEGTLTVSGTTATWSSGDLFSLYWTNGHIRLSPTSTYQACTLPPATTDATEYSITGFLDGNNMTLANPPASGLYSWCADNFALMIWRPMAPTDGSTVTLTGAKINYETSFSPQVPDNGAVTACYNSLVYGGYYCLWGSQAMFWINPTTGAIVDYGQLQGGGSGVTDSWQGAAGIFGENPVIDQTAPNLTWYMVAKDPALTTPLVIRGVFIPAGTPSQTGPLASPQWGPGIVQIENSTASTGTSSATWTASNGDTITYTNLTPETSANEGLFTQAAAFDSSFNRAYLTTGPNGIDCGLIGLATQGTIYLSCLTIGEDSPGWIFAFTPGDGNPAHAGSSPGPRIIGMVNTFNTPNPTYYTGSWPLPSTQGIQAGRSFHAMTETGATGWINWAANDYESMNTSANSVAAPASRAACSTFSAPVNSYSGTCFALQIDSHTVGSVTGYEPYLNSPSSPFLGTPGELRTTQIGDTACITTSVASGCKWNDQSHEAAKLVDKNYGGTQGSWIFQSAAYGAAYAVTGPVGMWWESFQGNIPPGSTTPSSGQVYWNAAAGCNGSPDPHGNCLMVDNNQTASHNEEMNGGVVSTTNSPGWASQPIWGWANVYQTEVGYVPATLGLPFTNVTPGVSPYVNYVMTNPPFAGVWGHPWAADAGSHPNPAGAIGEGAFAFDSIPVQGGQNEPTFTKVSGQLYVTTPTSNIDADDIFGYGTLVAINRKLMATGASCGAHPVSDISGPSSSITTGSTDNYHYCIARVGGECYSGSTVGQIYMNCPGVTTTQCAGVATHGGTPFGAGQDMCVGNIGSTADAVEQFTLNHTDYNGSYSRNLVSATSWLRMVWGFENNQTLPDNSWELFPSEYLNFARSDVWMAKLPPYPSADSVNRGTFVPVTLSLHPPAGLAVSNAIVEFGYQEYGAPGSFNCTTRNDACISTASTITPGNAPFYFASENPGGAPCASGCAITIPAISQRALFYRVEYRNASNGLIASGPLSATIVP